MDRKEYLSKYENWKKNASELLEELAKMTDAEIEEAFYRDLEFGTGGLRGVIGAGTNRMNVYTVAKASQGLANYVNKTYPATPKIAVAYDSRIKSDLFSRVASEVFAANGLTVYLYPELMPTPALSFAVRYFGCSAGVVVTASHNPSKYNGYKVYGPDGCQITTEGAAAVLSEIERLDVFRDVLRGDFDAYLAAGKIKYIGEDCVTAFLDAVKGQSVLFGDEIDRDVAIVYTPLNGTGRKPVTRILRESGFTNVTVVKEQEEPDGNFPTCPYPNPEIREALRLGLEYADRLHADLLLATDPDADRVGIAVRDGEGMKLLTGNETGMLLLDYIASQRARHGKMPADPVMIKTIVTIDMAERIAAHYGIRTVNVLTGFKFIGEQIGLLEKAGHADSYLFGFEESYGYLSGAYVRDKDAVDGAYLICEMFAYYRTRGIGLLERLNQLYAEYGTCLNTLYSYEFAGVAGFAKMQEIMATLRRGLPEIAGNRVERALDYAEGLDGLPKADVLKYYLAGNRSVVVRPSGTEPKIKIYLSVSAKDRPTAEATSRDLIADLEKRLALK